MCQRTEGAQGLCQQHEEKLQLFCKVEEAAICVVCSLSAEHREHAAVPIQEAALEYKHKLADWLPSLRSKKELTVASKAQEEEELKAMKYNLEAEKTKTLVEFQQLRQLLREQEDATLARLEEIQNKITRAEKTNAIKRLQQISSLDALIKEVNSKCAHPAEELLKDVRSTLRRCENETFQEQEKTTNEYKRKESILNHVKVFEPEMEMRQYKVPVTLDGDTAHGILLKLSENKRRVRGLSSQAPSQQYYFGSSACFQYPCVLGKEGVRSGRHYWEQQLLMEGDGWCVGVALASVNKRAEDSKSPEQGVWAMEGYHGHYTALTSPATPLPLRESPRLLGVYLDYEEGRVSLYKADTKEHLYTFIGAAFTEITFPYFYLAPGAELRLV